MDFSAHDTVLAIIRVKYESRNALGMLVEWSMVCTECDSPTPLNKQKIFKPHLQPATSTRTMNTQKIALVSASALTAGVAHGAIVYTYANTTTSISGGYLYIDLNQDGQVDFGCNFDGSPSQTKPYVNNSIGIAQPNYTPYVLSDSGNHGFPLTTNGTLIDASYESSQDIGYFWHDNASGVTGGNAVGAWASNGANIEGYVGLVMTDNSANNYYGWAHFIYNSAGSGTLNLVDYAMETTPNTGILAGETAPPNSGPVVAITPSSQTNYVGGTLNLLGVATGNPTPTIQWEAGAVGGGVYTNLVNGGNVYGTTANILTISNITSASTADYVVMFSNSISTATSAPATLTILPALISPTPSAVNLFAGGSATINVSYAASVPPNSFQWYKNGALLNDGGDISGSTSSNLILSSVSPSDSANYAVVAANAYGMVTSTVPVMVQAASLPYDTYVTWLNPAAYYRFNELANPGYTNVIAFDSFGGHNGIYGYQTANGNPTNNDVVGPIPPDYIGFSLTNTAVAITNATAYWTPGWVTTAPLNLNTNSGLANVTFTAWVYPTISEGAYAAVVSYRSSVSGTACGINYAGYHGANNTLGYHWNDNLSSWTYDSGLIIPAGQWSLLAVVIEPTNSEFYVINSSGVGYTNWVATYGTQTLANATAPLNTPGLIGGDAASPNFIGSVDNMAVFNQSLTYQQVTNLYNVAVTGQLPPPTIVLKLQKSGANQILTWTPALGTLLQAPSLSGPWTTNTAPQPYTVTPTQSQLFYKVTY